MARQLDAVWVVHLTHPRLNLLARMTVDEGPRVHPVHHVEEHGRHLRQVRGAEVGYVVAASRADRLIEAEAAVDVGLTTQRRRVDDTAGWLRHGALVLPEDGAHGREVLSQQSSEARMVPVLELDDVGALDQFLKPRRVVGEGHSRSRVHNRSAVAEVLRLV